MLNRLESSSDEQFNLPEIRCSLAYPRRVASKSPCYLGELVPACPKSLPPILEGAAELCGGCAGPLERLFPVAKPILNSSDLPGGPLE